MNVSQYIIQAFICIYNGSEVTEQLQCCTSFRLVQPPPSLKTQSAHPLSPHKHLEQQRGLRPQQTSATLEWQRARHCVTQCTLITQPFFTKHYVVWWFFVCNPSSTCVFLDGSFGKCVFFRGGTCGYVFWSRNRGVCSSMAESCMNVFFWRRNLRERVFSHVQIIWH